MNKSYKIKVNQGNGEAKFVDIPQVSGGGQPLTVKAVPGGKYQLLDARTQVALGKISKFFLRVEVSLIWSSKTITKRLPMALMA
jgi:hypothetical protein